MEIFTRAILQPRGGGEPLETFDSPEDPRMVEVDTILANYTQRFGMPFEVALTTSPKIEGPVEIGWRFALPHNFDMRKPLELFDQLEQLDRLEQLEMVLIPMFDDADTGKRMSLFLRMAEQRAAFQEMFDNGDLAQFHRVTMRQRDPAWPQHSEVTSQRRDQAG